MPRLSMVLKEGAMDEINRLKALVSSSSSSSIDADRLKEIKVILDCVRALEEIDRDMELFDQHLSGDDDKMKQTAGVFKKEFMDCREQIEIQLNKLL